MDGLNLSRVIGFKDFNLWDCQVLVELSGTTKLVFMMCLDTQHICHAIIRLGMHVIYSINMKASIRHTNDHINKKLDPLMANN